MPVSGIPLTTAVTASQSSVKNPDPAATAALQKSATDFETAFIAEMLNHIGLDATKGVAGAQGFSSFMNRAYSEMLSERGGIGIADDVFDALKARQTEDTP